MTRNRHSVIALLLAFVAATTGAQGGGYAFVTLGTQGGPVSNSDRGQPANLLVRPGEAWLVDAGDGAASAMQLAGVPFGQLKGVFLSHLHFDHVGGLSAVLGRRHQIRVTAPLRIYGPPGTKVLVAGLLDAMRPGAEAGFGVPGEVSIPPETNIEVTELRDGDSVTVGDFTVAVVNNTHYSFAPDDPKAEKFESLSFRFELPDRVIVYTGDTGPSDAVEALSKDADMLVTEMIDVDAAIENLRRQRQRQTGGGAEPGQGDRIARHLGTHHLTTTQIGEMAERAGVGRIVVTHIVAGSGKIDEETKKRWLGEIGESYNGPAVIAEDGERF